VSLQPGEIIFFVMPNLTHQNGPSMILAAPVWRHATYFVAGNYWPQFKIILLAETEGVVWSRGGSALDAFKTAVALSANPE